MTCMQYLSHCVPWLMHYFLMRLFALDLRIEKTGEVDYSIVIVIIPITDGIDRIDKRLASVKNGAEKKSN